MIMSKIKLLLIFSFAFAFLFAVQVGRVFAGSVVPSNDSFTNGLTDYSDENKLNSYAFNQSNSAQISISIKNLMVGVNNPKTGQVLVPGAIPGMGRAIAFLIKERPVGSDMYVADLIKHAPFTPSAYAQGIGFEALTPVLEIWKVFRDLTYVLFVLIFVIIGFMIMFRAKLNGNVVVTVESALPNLIVTLLLITFSYAIAGLLIDVMYLVLYLVVRVFESLIVTNGPTLTQIAFTNSIFDTGFSLIFNSSNGGSPSTVQNAASAVSTVAQGFFESFGVAGWVNKIGSDLLGIVGALVFALAIFFAIVRTFFKLLEAYIGFILGVIFAPFQLIAGALTGKSTFGDWINNLLANLAVFPLVVVMIFLAMALGGSGADGVGYKADNLGNISSGFTPPLVTLRSSNSGQIAYAFQAIISIGILMLLPEALKMTKDAFKSKGPLDQYMPSIIKGVETGLPLGSRVGLGGALGAAGAPIGGILGFGKGFLTSPQDRLRHGVSGAAQGFKSGTTIAGRNIGGLTPGIRTGVRAAAFVSKATGANQPDVLNPITGAIDKRFLPEEERKKQEMLNLWEDMGQRASGIRKK